MALYENYFCSLIFYPNKARNAPPSAHNANTSAAIFFQRIRLQSVIPIPIASAIAARVGVSAIFVLNHRGGETIYASCDSVSDPVAILTHP